MTQSDTKPFVPEHGPLWARAIIAIKNIALIGLVLSSLGALGALIFSLAGIIIDVFWVFAVGEETGLPFMYRGAIGVVCLLIPVVFLFLAGRAENMAADARDYDGGEGR